MKDNEKWFYSLAAMSSKLWSTLVVGGIVGKLWDSAIVKIISTHHLEIGHKNGSSGFIIEFKHSIPKDQSIEPKKEEDYHHFYQKIGMGIPMPIKYI
jgi:hypothetical protein